MFIQDIDSRDTKAFGLTAENYTQRMVDCIEKFISDAFSNDTISVFVIPNTAEQDFVYDYVVICVKSNINDVKRVADYVLLLEGSRPSFVKEELDKQSLSTWRHFTADFWKHLRKELTARFPDHYLNSAGACIVPDSVMPQITVTVRNMSYNAMLAAKMLLSELNQEPGDFVMNKDIGQRRLDVDVQKDPGQYANIFGNPIRDDLRITTVVPGRTEGGIVNPPVTLAITHAFLDLVGAGIAGAAVGGPKFVQEIVITDVEFPGAPCLENLLLALLPFSKPSHVIGMSPWESYEGVLSGVAVSIDVPFYAPNGWRFDIFAALTQVGAYDALYDAAQTLSKGEFEKYFERGEKFTVFSNEIVLNGHQAGKDIRTFGLGQVHMLRNPNLPSEKWSDTFSYSTIRPADIATRKKVLETFVPGNHPVTITGCSTRVRLSRMFLNALARACKGNILLHTTEKESVFKPAPSDAQAPAFVQPSMASGEASLDEINHQIEMLRERRSAILTRTQTLDMVRAEILRHHFTAEELGFPDVLGKHLG